VKYYLKSHQQLKHQNHPQVPAGQQRVNALINFDESTLLINALRKIYYHD
jgi:hypothetical protein